MSMEQLTGGMDWKAIERYGSDAHPMALDWQGEFSKCNRGVFGAVELLKNPAEFRNLFLTMAQEKQFKVPKFGYIDCDCAIVAHTNEAEFRAFMADPRNEALKDRLVTWKLAQIPEEIHELWLIAVRASPRIGWPRPDTRRRPMSRARSDPRPAA
jgi:predicted Ser/Thr protein kinase